MSSKTRKLIWSVPIMATLAVVGALAAFVVLGTNTAFAIAPQAPTAFATPGNTEVTVGWYPGNDGGSPVTSYEVEHKLTSAADTEYVAVTVNAPDQSTIIGNLTNSLSYDFRVSATNADGTGAASVVVAATPAAGKPSVPQNVELVIGKDSIKVTWSAPEKTGGQALTQYTVEFGEVPATGDVVYGGSQTVAFDADPLEATISPLDLGKTYSVRVAADNGIVAGNFNYAVETATTVLPDHDYEISSSSTSASSNVELRVKISDIPQRLVVGSSIELYLEDDYQVPASIPAGAAYFIVTGGTGTILASESQDDANRRLELSTGSSAPVLTTSPAIVGSDDHFAGDDDYGIQVVIPDLCAGSTQAGDGACDGQNGPQAGQTVTLVIGKTAGIKNPTEQKNYKVGAQVLPLGTPTSPNSGPDDASQPATLSVRAKVTLSDDDNTRGYELTITGSGFNNGTTADAYVLQAATAPADCQTLVANPNSTLVGSGLVGIDDTVAIPVEVTVPTFAPGKINHICVVDGENRHSSDTPADDNFDTFFLEPSIRAVPSTVSSGDTVNIFAQDFAIGSQSLTSLKLAGVEAIGEVRGLVRGTLVNGASTSSFEVPGSVVGEPLQGTVRLDARFGNLNADDECKVAQGCTSKNTKITVTGSELTASATNVLPTSTGSV